MRLESCITRLQTRVYLGGVQSDTHLFLYNFRPLRFYPAQKGSSRGVYIEAPPPPPPEIGVFRGFSGFRGFGGFSGFSRPTGAVGHFRTPGGEENFYQG